MTNNQNTATSVDMYSHMDGYASQEIIPDSHTTMRSVLDSFGVETIFDHTGEEMSLYPGVVLTVSNTSSRLEQFADALRFTMQLPCNL